MTKIEELEGNGKGGTKKMSLFRKAKEFVEHKETKATLVRVEHPYQESYIEITLPDGGKRELFRNIVAHCAKDLSPNERKKVIADCEEQIDNLKDGNCPTIFREMLNELKYGKFEVEEK